MAVSGVNAPIGVTRGFVQSDDNVMIAGIIVLDTLDEGVLVRAIGPSA